MKIPIGVLRHAGAKTFRFLDGVLPNAGWIDGLFCRVRFRRANGRFPRRTTDPLANFNDLIFERMAKGSWTALERTCVDKQYAKLIATAMCPSVKTSETRRVFHLSSAPGARGAADYLVAHAGNSEVAKPTHGSGAVLFLRNRPAADDIRRFCAVAQQSYYRVSRESQYRGLERKIILEDDLSGNGEAPADYKFFCSFGEVLFCQIDVDRFFRHRRCLVTPDFEWIQVRLTHDMPKTLPQRPDNFDEMLRAAEKLSRLFLFVRVDLYSVNGAVYFGEFTFAPEGGMGTLSSEHFGISVMKAIRRNASLEEESSHGS